MYDSYRPQSQARRYRGLTITVVAHILLAWLVISGTARNGLKILKKPLEAQVIQEVIIPPPPPPPPPPVKEIKPPEPKAPKVEAPPPPPFIPPAEVVAPPSAAPAIAAVVTPPAQPVVIAPPPPPAPPAPPAAPKAPARSDIGVACPTQVAPEMPRRAMQDGTEGVVRAQALIRDGAVRDVTILSGPRVFHNAVKAAMMQYKCVSDSGEVLATQEFNFKLE